MGICTYVHMYILHTYMHACMYVYKYECIVPSTMHIHYKLFSAGRRLHSCDCIISHISSHVCRAVQSGDQVMVMVESHIWGAELKIQRPCCGLWKFLVDKHMLTSKWKHVPARIGISATRVWGQPKA